ncbi:MAG: hypothetical protein FJX65_15535 [Alphaproteobacteria bacterium]|nr:hypothetical protein [Alphaproteobacteria bacterium]
MGRAGRCHLSGGRCDHSLGTAAGLERATMARKTERPMAKVFAKIARPSPDVVAEFRCARLDQIVKSLPRDRLMDMAIKPLGGSAVRIVGPAVTVAAGTANPMLAVVATGVVRPGDVIVIAAGGDSSGYTWGGGLTLSAQNVGCEGVVVDGLVIDADSILERSVPVFCRGATLHPPAPVPPGSINVEVVCGGAKVCPGDLIVGALDGVCVIPREELSERLAQAITESQRIEANIAKLQATKGTIFDLRGGRQMARDLGLEWVD